MRAPWISARIKALDNPCRHRQRPLPLRSLPYGPGHRLDESVGIAGTVLMVQPRGIGYLDGRCSPMVERIPPATSTPELAAASMPGFSWRATLVPVAPAARFAAAVPIWWARSEEAV